MNLFELYARIALDTSEYEGGIERASQNTSSLASKLKSGLATAGKAAAAGLAATTSAAVALGKSALDSYAEYEQLVGGIETLFKTSAQTVQDYAASAYKTAGMSANEYMSTVTSFSASLISSLGGDTAKAAEYADMAITDMSDNANKMGTSMEMIQNAYQGFAKQNYTMLDNLKLGYGGTKEEMQRLLEKAEELQAQQGNYVEYSIDSYADIVEAIHVVQTEMGITGTTAKEASETIAGSLASAGAAWKNLTVGVADENANLEELIDQFVESVTTAAENVVPRVEQILAGIGVLVERLAPIIAEQVPALVTNVLPSFLKAGVTLLEGIIEGITSALPALVETAIPIILSLIDGIIEQLPKILEAAIQIVLTLAEGIISALPQLAVRIPEIIVTIVTTLLANLPQIAEVGIQIILGLIQGIIQAIAHIPAAIAQVVSALVNGFKSLLGIHSPSTVFMEIGANLVAGLLEGIKNTWESVLAFFTGAVEALIEFFGKAWETIKEAAVTAWEAIKTALEEAWKAIETIWTGAVDFFTGIWDSISKTFDKAKTFFGDVFKQAWEAVKSAWSGVKSFFSGIWNDIKSVFSGVVSNFKEIGRNIVIGLKSGISGAWTNLKSWFGGKVGGLIDAAMSKLGINSPSKVFAGIGQNMVLGLGVGWEDEYDAVKAQIEDGLQFEPAKIDVEASTLYKAQMDSRNPERSRDGDTYNFYSPKALDAVTAAREMRKAKQQMALGYV